MQLPRWHICPSSQSLPQPPQLFGSLRMLTSQPSMPLPLQSRVPLAAQVLQTPEAAGLSEMGELVLKVCGKVERVQAPFLVV